MNNTSHKNFSSLSQKECIEEYKGILQNAERCWKSGEILAKDEDYGRAISLAIISIEEIIKAAVIFLDGKGFRFRKVKGIRLLFRTHQIRYFIAFAMFVVTIFGDDLIKFIQSLREKDKSGLDKLQRDFSDKALLESKAEQYAKEKFLQIAKELEWFSKVDVLRQNGFYCDYDEQLINPIQISRTEYFEVLQKLEKVRKVGAELIRSFDSDDELIAEQLSKALKEFNENDRYKSIERFLDKVKGKNLFTLFIDRMSKGIDDFLTP
jgi:AbiV family abortive infection protein